MKSLIEVTHLESNTLRGHRPLSYAVNKIHLSPNDHSGALYNVSIMCLSTGVCLPNYERPAAEDGQASTLQLNGYVRYSCSEEGVLVHLYNDENCESSEDDFNYAIVYVPHSLCATVHHNRY